MLGPSSLNEEIKPELRSKQHSIDMTALALKCVDCCSDAVSSHYYNEPLRRISAANRPIRSAAVY